MATRPHMADRGRKPRLVAPSGACETHSHIYGPRERYPHQPGREPDLVAEVPAFLAMLDRIGFERAVVVQPSLYGFDNRATLDAVRDIGLDRARGVAVCRPDVSDAELDELHARGIRGLRYFLLVDDLDLDSIEAVGRRCEDRGWHVIVQGDGDWLVDAIPVLRRVACPMVIDHIGRTPPAEGVNHTGFVELLRLMETGRCWVKISAPYLSSEVGPPGYGDVAERVEALVRTRPDRLMWAANWPHPSHGIDEKPDEADCLDPLLEWVPDEAVRRAILVDNPAALYGFDP